MEFEWDPDKEKSDFKERQAGFAEAKPAFSGPLEFTIPDPTQSFDAGRLLSSGRSETDRLWYRILNDTMTGFASSAPDWHHERSKDSMNKEIEDAAMLPEYDFSKGTRGIHHRAYRRGTTVVRSNGNREHGANATDLKR